MKVSGILLTIAGALLLIGSLILLASPLSYGAAYLMWMLGYALLTASGIFLILKK